MTKLAFVAIVPLLLMLPLTHANAVTPTQHTCIHDRILIAMTSAGLVGIIGALTNTTVHAGEVVQMANNATVEVESCVR